MSRNRSVRGALTRAAAVLLLGLGGAAAAAEGPYAPMPAMGRFLSAPKDAAVSALAGGQIQVQAPAVEEVSVSLTADSIQRVVPDPALGVQNMDIVLIDLPRVAFSRPVPIMGAGEGQQDFFLTALSADRVCAAFGFGPHASGSYSIYIPVKAGTVLMALDKNLYQVQALVDRDFAYIRSLACKAR